MNYIFFGTPDVASETLQILKQSGFLPSLIVTATDKPQGRKMLLTPPPVKIWAIENNIPYVQPENTTELLSILSSRGSHSAGEGRSDEKLEEAKYDLFVVVAYGKILPEEIINMPKLGSINIHYSLLPKYRGASPVETAILNGDKETGVTIQKMVYKMDAGDIIAVEKTEILPDETAPELRKRLIKIGGELLVKILTSTAQMDLSTSPYVGGGWKGVLQDETQATFCKKIKKEDGHIDLNDNAVKNYNKFRAYAYWPRTFFFREHLPTGSQERIIITKAKLENGQFVIEKVIPEGGKEIDYKI